MTTVPTRVAIIGGGISGMAAAHALATHAPQLRVTLFEAKRCTGGRAGSFIDPETGDAVDYCQHVAMGCCTNLIALMRDTGLIGEWSHSRQLRFYHPRHQGTVFESSRWLPAPLHLGPSFLRLPYLKLTEKVQIARAMRALMKTEPSQLREISGGRWLRSHGQSNATISRYWEVVIASALGETCERVSMAAVRKVFVDGFLAHPQACDLWVPRIPLADIFGERLPRVLQSLGVEVRTGQAAMVSHDPMGNEGMTLARGAITLNTDNPTDDTVEPFDHVIVAVPGQNLARVIPRELGTQAKIAIDQFMTVACSPITGLHLWFDRPVIDEPHAVLVDTLAQWVFRRPATSDDKSMHYVQVVVSASHGLRKRSHQEVIEQVVAELRVVFPSAAHAKLLRGRLVTDPQSVFSLSPETDAIRPPSRTALPWLHLGGDFVQTGWPATMEGAVIGGKMAANSVLDAIGLTPCPIDDGLPRSSLSRMLIR